MLEKATLKPKKLNIVLGLLALLLAVGGVLGFAWTARADSGPDEITDWVDWDAVAAKTIGVEVDALFDEMMDGNKSIAGVAQAHNVEAQKVIEAIVTAEKEWLKQQVAKGTIPQKEAGEMLASESELREDVRAYVEEKDVFIFDEGDFPEDEMFFEGVDWFSVAAKTIGVDDETLFNKWDEGKSLADVAKAHNVEAQKVIDAVVAAEKEWLVQLVADEELSQEEAGEWLAELEKEVVFFVKAAGWVDWFEVAAQTIGVEVDALFQFEEKSIADVAAANNVAAQKVIDAIVTAEENWLKTQVANGALSQAEAGEWLAADSGLAEEARLFVEQTGSEGFFGDADMEFMNGVDWFNVAAKAIGVEVDALFDGLAEGKSIAEMAKANNVEAQKVVAAIVSAEKEWLTQLVAGGELSQDEADQWLAELETEARVFVEETGGIFDELPVESLFISPVF